jgi:hypothetical protein
MIHYVLDNAKPEASGRFDALAAIFDAGTKRHVEALGPVDNWRCLEVAAAAARSRDGWPTGSAQVGGSLLPI